MASLGLHDYTTLLNALPALPGQVFEAKITPISRYQLERRLTMLQPEHLSLVQAIEDLLRWDHLAMERSDQELVALAGALLPRLQPMPDLHELVLRRLDMRSLVAALRYRNQQRSGERAATAASANVAGDVLAGSQANQPMAWNYGRFRQQIEQHWQQPYFSLQHRFAWLQPVAEALIEEQALEVEKLLLQAAWSELASQAIDHQFDLVAVVIYVMRWNIVARWTRYHDQQAVEQFDRLVAQGLATMPPLFTVEAAKGRG